MKKLLMTLFITALASMIMAQQFAPSPSGGSAPPPGRDNEFFCEPNSVFSQVFPTFTSGYYCQSGYNFNLAADDYSALGPFSTMRFWGGDFYGCSMAPTEVFDIFIWDGKPGSGGNLVNTFTLAGTVTPISVIFIGTQMYQIDIDLGTTVNQLNGWIGITRMGASCDPYLSDYGFAWLFDNNNTGNSIQYYGTWIDRAANHLFCLGAEKEQQAIPISNWALFIGIGLILVFAVVRFRKMI
jgi:hypothetical protein